MNQDMVWQLVRYSLLAAGGYLTGKGYTDDATAQAMIGALMVILPGAWGVYVKWSTKTVPASAVEGAPVPTLSPTTGKVEEPK